jgi:hypothetical protein
MENRVKIGRAGCRGVTLFKNLHGELRSNIMAEGKLAAAVTW